jgi:arginine decarboxylase
VCADQVTPYPPGIPVLVPGQMITAAVLDFLVGLLRSQKRMELHGVLYDGYLPCLRVLRASEERGLKKIG